MRCWFVDWMVGWSVGLLADWLVRRSGRSFDRFVD